MTHPSGFLPPAVAPILREEAAMAEMGRDLTLRQLELIYQQQWFRLLVPRHFGGAALPVPAIVRLEEGISWADGSVGWVMTLCSGAGWFAGFFPPQTSLAGLFSDDRLCLAGSGASSGRAICVSGGYRISGQWKYASGSLHATAFTANCVIKDEKGVVSDDADGGGILREDSGGLSSGGVPLADAEGKPLVRAFLLMRQEVNIIRDWDTIGLIATGSHGFSVDGLFVPEDRAFDIHPDKAMAGDVLYRYPFLPLAEATLAANIAGMAHHFLDCCKELFAGRQLSQGGRNQMDAALVEEERLLQECRSDFYRAVDASWAFAEDAGAGGSPGASAGAFAEAASVSVEGSAGPVDESVFAEVSRTSRALSVCARHLVDRLYPLGGLAAARPGAAINRVWRDFHTATQHNLLAFVL